MDDGQWYVVIQRQWTADVIQGFHFSPIHGIRAAWAVHSTAVFSTANIPMTFGNVSVMVGIGRWNGSSALVNIAGIHYTIMAATQHGSVGLSFVLYQNGLKRISLLKQNNDPTGSVTRESAVVMEYDVSDVIEVRFNTGYSCQGFNSFFGFLLNVT